MSERVGMPDRMRYVANSLVTLAVVLFGWCWVLLGFSMPNIVLGVLVALVLYWRFRVFPISGFIALKVIGLWGLASAACGALIGIVVATLCAVFLHMQMHHGLAFVVVGICILLGLLFGLIMGYRRYKKSSLPSSEARP